MTVVPFSIICQQKQKFIIIICLSINLFVYFEDIDANEKFLYKYCQMRKNILQLVGNFNQGGSERQAVQLIRLLNEDKNHNIFLAALNNDGVLRGEVE